MMRVSVYRALGWLLLALTTLFVCVPIAFVVVTSFNEKGIYFLRTGYSFSLHWYESLPKGFFSSFKVSIIVAVASALLALPPGIAAAFVIVRGHFPGKALLANLFLSPLILPLIVLGVSYYRYFIIIESSTGAPLPRFLHGPDTRPCRFHLGLRHPGCRGRASALRSAAGGSGRRSRCEPVLYDAACKRCRRSGLRSPPG
jgi:ABC-type glycerol-3-phosphate transport system permease component